MYHSVCLIGWLACPQLDVLKTDIWKTQLVRPSRPQVGTLQLQTIYFNHPSRGNSTNYQSGSQRQGCASHKSTNRSFPSEASEASTPSSIFIFYFFFIHSRDLVALNQSAARFAELGEYSQNMVSGVFWTPNVASPNFFQVRQIPRTRFAKQKFAQLKTNYFRRTFFRFDKNPS